MVNKDIILDPKNALNNGYRPEFILSVAETFFGTEYYRDPSKWKFDEYPFLGIGDKGLTYQKIVGFQKRKLSGRRTLTFEEVLNIANILDPKSKCELAKKMSNINDEFNKELI